MSIRLENTTARPGLSATLLALGFERTPPAPSIDDAARVGPSRFRVTASRGSMATRVSITVLGPSVSAAHDAIGLAFGEMDRVVSLLDGHAGGSALSVLNDQGRLVAAPGELLGVLGAASRLHHLSAGAFDVTVKPLVDCLRRGDRDLAAQRALVGMSGLAVQGDTVTLQRSGMSLTLDGIAKGYVVDRMADVLVGRGAAHWIIEAGGDIRAQGVREDGRPWRIGVQDPGKSDHHPAVLSLRDGAVATSGSYENFFSADRRSHHIVDSATGRSPAALESATVRAPTAVMADALATAVFVMPPERAIPFIDGLPGCAALLLDAGGGQLPSRSWQDRPTPTH